MQHQNGEYTIAIDNWRSAVRVASSLEQTGQALRGQASSTFRRGGPNDNEEADDLAMRALSAHQKMPENSGDGPYLGQRQILESARVLARIRLLPLLRQEVQTRQPSQYQLAAVRDLLIESADPAADFLAALREAGPPDQHEINYYPLRSMIEALAPNGSRAAAKHYARLAGRLATRSEDLSLPTAAGISPEYAAKANRAARVRAAGAWLVARLATPGPGARRRAALWVATRDKLL
ncbi:MAG TPA: hypothetical protein VLF91_03775 [Candidatus Saccharimonadales bacterium]|nr:hypothetical protein [Candidatus Saccharimonadales bacterium]